MKKMAYCLLVFGTAQALLAESPCKLDVHGYNRTEVPVNTVVDYNGHKIEVSLDLGDRYEPQKVLQIHIDDSYTAIYDPKINNLIQHGLNDGTRVQCYFTEL